MREITDSSMTQQKSLSLFFDLLCLSTTRESQYSTKPFEQTLSVDLCGTAGKNISMFTQLLVGVYLDVDR